MTSMYLARHKSSHILTHPHTSIAMFVDVDVDGLQLCSVGVGVLIGKYQISTS